MRVLMVSKALVTGVYQKKVEELAKLPGIDLRVIVPPLWREDRVGDIPLQRRYTEGYDLVVENMRFNGHHHVHYYPGLGRQVREFRPDLVHIDEEPYNLVAAHATFHARRAGAKTVFFAWQNLYRRYPPPFSSFERYCYRAASAAIVGNHDAGVVLRRKGFRKPLVLIPQFGVDPDFYRPIEARRRPIDGPVVGYMGRVVPEKGIDTLIEAVARVPSRPMLRIVGSGTGRVDLELLAERLGVRDRVRFESSVPGERVPDVLNELDVLVLPSRSRPNWTEQFGRILVEAMACGVPVIGSNSGEIPNVIDEAGLVFPEGDAEALADRIRRIIENPDDARELGRLGRQRVLENYTQQQIARQTYDLYQRILAAGEQRAVAPGKQAQGEALDAG